MALKTWLLTALAGLAHGLASTDTITWGGDNSRAGYLENHNMDPSVVGSSQFGQLFRTLLPGRYGNVPEQIFSQPLVYTPEGGDGTQFVYVATQQNNVYKLNAKTGEIIASRNLHIPFLTADLDGCVDVNPHVGITATGVIDPATGTLYLTSKTYADQTQIGVAQGRPAGRYFIHALDVNDLSERPNFPVDLEGTVARNNPIRSFGGGIHHQRPGLLHYGQYIYAGFASHCVQYNFTGWIIGWDKTTGAIVERFALQGDGVPADIPGAGVWMSGGGLASDNAGSMFWASGNGYASQLSNIPVNGRNPPTALEEAAVHMIINDDGSTTVADFFMPWEKQALDGADKDLGTSPLQILPSSTFSCGDVRRIGVVTGKSGKTYWINLDNMGGYRNGPNNFDAVIQTYQNDNSVYAGAGVYPLEGGYVYINVIQHPSNVFKFSCENGVPSFTKVAESPMDNAYILGVSHGTVTSLNGQPGTGLLWTLDVQGSQLKIFEAVPKDGLLNLVKSFSVPGSTKFGRAVFGDGIMYQGTTQGYLYAFGSPVTTPIECTSPNEFGTADVGSEGEPRTITCTAIIGVTVSDIGLDDTDDFTLSGVGTLPLTLAVGETFSVDVAFKPTTVGLISADIVVNTTNSAEGYSQGTHIRLTGTGESAGPLLSVTPPTITFQGVIAGSEGNLEEQIIFSNQGNSELAVTEVQYSTISAQGPFETWDGSAATLTVGKFTLSNIPATIAANSGATVRIAFDSAEAGSYGAYLRVVSDGGTKSFTIAGSAGPAPVALIEFQTPDGTGWVEYDADKNFTFGNVTENTSLSLKFRVTNAAPEGGVKLTLTVSKPPFGIPGIISAANQVDLAEGISLAPGESADATMVCSVPKSQWNVDPYTNTAPWTMNTNDPNFEKHFFTFECTAVSEQAPPLLPDGQGRYRYIGCYKENNPGRQLSNQLYGNPLSTNAMCIEACAERGSVFCGTQYHTECWGGPNIPVQQVDPRNCNFECGGDLNQVCGGNGFGELEGGAFISLFADSLQWDGNTTTPIDPGTGPNPTAPEVNPGVGGYVSEGCYTEATDTRALPNLIDLEEKTVANCVAACSARRNTYAGLEYGGECWCGNILAEGSVPADNAAECSMPCADNSTEYCGGPSRLNLYKLEGDFPEPTTTSAAATGTATSAVPTATAPSNERVGDWLFQGCFTEGDGVRALPARTYADDEMTLESCGAFCEGLQYFGTEYGRECWCGAELDATSLEAPLSECSFPCAGDDTQKCGAGNRLQVYQYSPEGAATSAAPTTEVSATETATETATGTATETATGTATEAATETATESATASATEEATGTATGTATETATEAATETATEAATETSTEAATETATEAATETASDTAGSQTAVTVSATEEPATTLVPSTLLTSTTAGPVLEGDTTTSASPSTTTSTTSAVPTPTGPVIVPGNENFTYYGCFSEPEVGRLLPTQVLNDGEEMTIDKCLGVCYDKRYAGVEYGRECWCGDALSLGGADDTRPAANETGTDCSFTCPGNSTQFCGAGSRISLYILTELLEELESQNRTVARRF